MNGSIPLPGSRALLVLALAGLLVLAGCTAPIDTAEAASSTVDDGVTTVVTTGTGSVTADADLAVVRLSVVATADSADAARADAADRSDALVAALVDAGVPEDAITTAGFSLTPEYDYSGSDREVVGYRAVHSYTVEVAPDRAGVVVDTAVAAADTEVWGVSFTLSDEARADLRGQAVEAAVSDARSDADAAAAAAGLTVSGVEHVSVGVSGGYDRPVFERAADAAGESTEFRPGPVTVSVSVTVTYTAA